jgi:hypothetical protein
MNKNNIKLVGKCLLFDNEIRILVIGDLHLGYGSSESPSGMLIAKELFERTIGELKEVFGRTGEVDEVVLIGDVKHEFGKISKNEWDYSDRLIELLKENSNKIIAIKGNHDILTGILADKLKFEIRDFYIRGDTIFVHGDKDFNEIWKKDINTVILGHIHPAIELDDGVRHEKYKCFLKGKYKTKEVIIVPSFTEKNKGTDPRDSKIFLPWKLNLNEFNVFVVDENLETLEFGKLKKIG